nr:hypothetical protein [Phytoactinopolyspora limicola]
MAEIAEGSERAGVEREPFAVAVPAAHDSTEEDLVIPDVVMLEHAAFDLGECSADGRQAAGGGVEFARLEPRSPRTAN